MTCSLRTILNAGIVVAMICAAEMAVAGAPMIPRASPTEFNLIGPDGKSDVAALAKSSLGQKLLQALRFIKTLPSLNLATSDFNHNAMTTSPYDFFRARVATIVIDERADSDECSDQRVAFVLPSFREQKKIWVCRSALNFDLLTVSSVLLHEARHEEGSQFDHVPCVAGPLKGQFSCDENYQDGGSYAIGLEYLVKLSRSPLVPADVRAQARRAAITDFLERFNNPPLDIQAGAFLRVAGSKELLFYDGTRSSATGIEIGAQTVLSLQGGLPLFFEPTRGTTHLYAFQTHDVTPVPDVLTQDFENTLSPTERSELLDVVYTDTLACLLLKKSLICYGVGHQRVQIAIVGFEPRRFVFAKQSLLFDPESLSVLDQAGAVHPVPFTPGASPTWTVDDRPGSHFVLLPWEGGELSLSAGGELKFFSYHARDWQVLTGLPEEPLSRVIAPAFWSTRLKEL